MPQKRKSSAKPPRLKKQQKTAKVPDEPTIAESNAQNETPRAIVANGDDALLDISINFTAINAKAAQPREMTPPEQDVGQVEESTELSAKTHTAQSKNKGAPGEDNTANTDESTGFSTKTHAVRLRKTEISRQNKKDAEGNVDSLAKTPATRSRKKGPPKQSTKSTEGSFEASTEENAERDTEGSSEESAEKNAENTEGNAEGDITDNIGNIEKNSEPSATPPATRIRKKASKQNPKDGEDQSGPKDDAEVTKPTRVRKPRKRPPRPPREKWVDPDPYIPRTTISKHAKQPVPVSFPLPSTHVLESRPTQNGCLWCRWNHKQNPDTVKVRKSTIGCKECNIPLCRECFVSFHTG